MTLKAVRRLAGTDRGAVSAAPLQPHLSSLQRIHDAFYDADVLLVTDIYPANESPIPDVTARGFVKG